MSAVSRPLVEKHVQLAQLDEAGVNTRASKALVVSSVAHVLECSGSILAILGNMLVPLALGVVSLPVSHG